MAAAGLNTLPKKVGSSSTVAVSELLSTVVIAI
jgi:hypothetical protein